MPSAQTQSLSGWLKKPQGQGCVAFLILLRLKAKRPVNTAYPADLKTIGNHIRKTRLDRDLSQPDVARIIGVTTDCITNWELNRNYPKVSLFPGIINFLGYNPYKTKNMTFGHKVKIFRYENGLQVKYIAKRIGIDPETLVRIENDRKYFRKSYLKTVKYFDNIG